MLLLLKNLHKNKLLLHFPIFVVFFFFFFFVLFRFHIILKGFLWSLVFLESLLHVVVVVVVVVLCKFKCLFTFQMKQLLKDVYFYFFFK